MDEQLMLIQRFGLGLKQMDMFRMYIYRVPSGWNRRFGSKVGSSWIEPLSTLFFSFSSSLSWFLFRFFFFFFLFPTRLDH